MVAIYKKPIYRDMNDISIKAKDIKVQTVGSNERMKSLQLILNQLMHNEILFKGRALVSEFGIMHDNELSSFDENNSVKTFFNGFFDSEVFAGTEQLLNEIRNELNNEIASIGSNYNIRGLNKDKIKAIIDNSNKIDEKVTLMSSIPTNIVVDENTPVHDGSYFYIIHLKKKGDEYGPSDDWRKYNYMQLANPIYNTNSDAFYRSMDKFTFGGTDEVFRRFLLLGFAVPNNSPDYGIFPLIVPTFIQDCKYIGTYEVLFNPKDIEEYYLFSISPMVGVRNGTAGMSRPIHGVAI